MNWFREIFSENGELSSKRVFGGLIVVCCMVAILVTVFKEGCTEAVKSLIDLSMVLGTSLLGLSTVTSIWKGPSATAGGNAMQVGGSSATTGDSQENKQNNNKQ